MNFNVCKFSDVKEGQTFRAMRNDVVWTGQTARVVNNNGTYAKVGATIAVDIAAHNKECIFKLDMPCKLLGKTVDVHNLEIYKLIHRGKP